MENNNYIFTLYPISSYPIPDYYSPSFDSWHTDAMRILASRSESEIAAILLDIDTYSTKMLSKYSDTAGLSRALQNLSHQNIDTLYEHDLYPGRYQIVSLLHLRAEGKAPDSISSVPELKWEECFACALLGKIAFAFDRESKLKGVDFDTSTYGDAYYDIGEYMGMFALDCMEIHGILSSIPGVTGYGLPARAMLVSQSKRANAKKYKASEDAKNRFFEWFDQGRNFFGTNIEAIVEYRANQIPDDDRKIITSNRMLEVALRQRKKKDKAQ